MKELYLCLHLNWQFFVKSFTHWEKDKKKKSWNKFTMYLQYVQYIHKYKFTLTEKKNSSKQPFSNFSKNCYFHEIFNCQKSVKVRKFP